MEQRLAVGGKRVTTGRLSSVVVDLFREAFPGPGPVGETEAQLIEKRVEVTSRMGGNAWNPSRPASRWDPALPPPMGPPGPPPTV